jgi:hypothetical protein
VTVHGNILRFARRNCISLLALFVALGGGYAIAAGNTDPAIHGCLDSKTRVLHVQKRCHRGQTPLVWNQEGPQGQQGVQGPPAVSAWAVVGSGGHVPQGTGITVQHTGPGTYSVTATPPACAGHPDAPAVNPEGTTASGGFPYAWAQVANNTFTVHTGSVSGGSFTPGDDNFEISVSCS